MTEDLKSFNYLVSHDLKSPSRRIRQYAGILRSDYPNLLSNETSRILNTIDSLADHMTEHVDAVLNLAIVSNKELDCQDVDLSFEAHKIISELRNSEPDRVVYISIDEKMNTSSDPALLRAILRNLLDNAWKFTGKNAVTRIEVGCEISGNRSVYYVKDNGIGIDMNKSDDVFKPFKRLAMDTDYAGSGVGTTIILRAVDRLGGEVWFDSTPGNGTTFFFTLGL
jgi:light-regulated signal transduction histidine kinase (bacteriophytochrome)